MISDKLPAVLTFPGSKQPSISVYRALKQAHTLLNECAHPESLDQEDAILAALDDLELMLGAVKE